MTLGTLDSVEEVYAMALHATPFEVHDRPETMVTIAGPDGGTITHLMAR